MPNPTKRQIALSLAPARQRMTLGHMEDNQPVDDPFDITGKVFSHYNVRRRIGAGGMGMVYEAEDIRLDRTVALKILPPWSRFDEDAKTRFWREAKAASSLNHPNICTVFEYDDVDGRPLIAMEYVEGVTLAERLKSSTLASDDAMATIADVASGLQHAHSRRITHRDIKPGNILISNDGRVKITDFGLAKLADATTITRSGATFGTVVYMSPEQARGDPVTEKTDIWSLGVVLFESLLGRRPFDGEHASAVLYQILNTEPSGLEELSSMHGDDVLNLITRCLEKDASERPSAVEVLDFAQARATTAAPPDRLAESTPSIGKLSRRWTLAATLVVMVGLGLAYVVNSRNRPYPSDLESSTIAILPPVVTDSSLGLTLRGLVESTARAVSKPALEKGLVGQVAPFDDAQVEEIESAADAGRIIGVPYAVASRYGNRNGRSSLTFSLVSTETLDTLRSATATVNLLDIHDSRRQFLLAVGSLLGLSEAELGADMPKEHPASPGAAEYYAQGLGLLQLRSSPTSVAGAISLFERAIEAYPNFAAAHAELGRAYLYQFRETSDVGLLRRAERLCDDALELDPSNESVHITLGQIYLEKGSYALAAMEFDRVLESTRFRAEALLGKARVFDHQGRFADAEAMFKAAIAERPEYWPGYRELALFYYFRSRYEDAVSQFEIVAELAPLNPLGYRGMGSSYYGLEEFELARTYWEKALEIADDDDTYSNLGALHFFLGDYERAAAAFEKAISLDSTNYLVWSNLAMAYDFLPGREKDLRKAATTTISMAKELLALNPRNDFIRARLAGVYILLDDTTEALAYLEPYRGSPDPELAGETVFEIATAWEALGRRDRAFQWLDAALRRGYSQTELMRYPGLADLRKDPRFLDLINSVPSGETEG